MSAGQFQLVYNILSVATASTSGVLLQFGLRHLIVLIGLHVRWIVPVGPQHLAVLNGFHERCAVLVGPQHLVARIGSYER